MNLFLLDYFDTIIREHILNPFYIILKNIHKLLSLNPAYSGEVLMNSDDLTVYNLHVW